jgi:hypothetical protein
MTSIDVELLGERGRVEVDDRGLAARLAATLVDVTVEAAGPPTLLPIRVTASSDGYTVERDDAMPPRSIPTRGAVIDWVLSRWNKEVLYGSEHLCIHTGAVVGPAGTLLLPAVSGSGKSTLTAALVQAGYGYLSDEAIAFELGSGALMAYPKPISLKSGSWPLFAALHADADGDGDGDGDGDIPRHVAASTVRPGAPAHPAPVVAIVFPEFDAEGRSELAPIGRAEALVELATDTIRFNERARPNLDRLAGVVRGASCHRLVHADLERAVAALRPLLGGPA